ncbi:MAG: extracellular solute-binding protein [Lachnospiraceae bacterium]|nr:extracellular solute-binding protein [Lachnospiraceae bacterium]
MKKRIMALLMAGVMVCSMAACGQKAGNEGDSKDGAPKKADSISVTTTFAGEDGNAKNYKDACKAFTEKTGIAIKDSSATSDKTFKSRVATDFETGSEPDVLFFFTGADASSFIEQDKVVPLDEIREKYPDYAGNMDDGKLPGNLVNDKNYVVPVNGYWEGLFCNKAVLDKAGVAVPGADYTWDQFLQDCEKIKKAGYTPIAASLGEIPHYWWEYSIFNNTTLATHTQIPASVTEGNGPAWVQGMEDIKALYEAGYFPKNTVSAKDSETFAMFTEDKAAFLIDGSWKVGGIIAACQSDPEDAATLDQKKLDKFTVTYVPAKADSDRKATDLIGGISSGYYITRKAWDDDAKREAAVEFVKFMTTDEMVGKFAQHSATALKEAPKVENVASLQTIAIEMTSKTTSFTDAAQDVFNGDCRVSTFDGMANIVTGKVSAKDAVAEGLKAYAEQQK